jgi:hypothetical protein|tara:strand:- start:25090 stop:25710 length:621 start_codon:yes stop_codon:yes gene_type:complete
MAVTTAAVIGVAASAGGAINSFSQSAKQGRLAEKAEAEAKRNMAAAKKKAEKNFYDGLNVSTEAYDAAFENNLQAQTQNIQALQEGDSRNLAAGVGLVQQSSDATANATRLALQKDLELNAKMKAQAKDAINQDLKRIDLGQAKDNEMKAKDAFAAKAEQFSQGITGVANTMGAAGQLSPLFGGKDLTDSELAFLQNMQNQGQQGL